MVHVDIVSHNPLSTHKELLARLNYDGQALDLQLAEGRDNYDQMWDYLRSRTTIDPDTAPYDFMRSLYEGIDATYVYASEAHEATDCSFNI